jgi:hypothetical protein
MDFAEFLGVLRAQSILVKIDPIPPEGRYYNPDVHLSERV